MLRRCLLVALLAIPCLPASGGAGEAFYLLMFGSQRVPAQPDYSHTFATFVRASWEGEGDCPIGKGGVTLEPYTISWLPENMTVRTWALLPECGFNFDLHTTIRWAQNNCMRVSLWGAYRICPELYYLAAKQVGLLQSGQVRYKAVDSFYPTDRVTNCIHAVSSTVAGYRLRIGTPGYGEAASFAVLKRFEPYVLDNETPHPWVGSALGLDQYPILYRDWTNPRAGFLGPIYRALGGERDLIATYGPPTR